MTSALAHRGPDGDTIWLSKPTESSWPSALGDRGSASGSQPMWNEDGQVDVIFNGEIYNHAELRSDLERCAAATASPPTIRIPRCWEQWAEDLPPRTNGMFACAILDRRRQRLFLARDRFGEKPLYYAARPGFLAFASELTALAEHPAVSRSIAVRALQKFFAYGYIPAPHAILEGTSKLLGSHWLSYDFRAGRLVTKAYWRFVLERTLRSTTRTSRASWRNVVRFSSSRLDGGL